MSAQGTVKSFNEAKGWGFIESDGKDIFLHSNDCTDGLPSKGDVLYFDLEEDPKRNRQLKAVNVTGCSKSTTSASWTAAPTKLEQNTGSRHSHGNGATQATVKSFSSSKGWGFIDMDGTDVFVHRRDCLDGEPTAGDVVTFDAEKDPVRDGQLKAKNVAGCTGTPSSASISCVSPAGRPRGVVKSYNAQNGWGFIDYDGKDVFLHSNDCKDGLPSKGDIVVFDVEEDPKRNGQLKAVSVTGCGTSGKSSPAPQALMQPQIPMMGMCGMGYYPPSYMPMYGIYAEGAGYPQQQRQSSRTGNARGTVKSFNAGKGWGFIDYNGIDVFVHSADCVDGAPQNGDYVAFDVEQDPVRNGQMKAKNVTGCTGGSSNGEGRHPVVGGYPMAYPMGAYGPTRSDKVSYGFDPYGRMMSHMPPGRV